VSGALEARELTPCWPPFKYEPGSGQQCPGCGGRSWHVGRVNAECAECGTALPLRHGTSILYGRHVSEDRQSGLWDQLARKVRFAP